MHLEIWRLSPGSSSRALVEGVVIHFRDLKKAWMATAGPDGLLRHDESTSRLFR